MNKQFKSSIINNIEKVSKANKSGLITMQEAMKRGNTMKTETKHTPGPWHLHDMEQFTICGPNYKAVAETKTRRSDDECRANARLIAAAPELLEACKAVIAALSQNKTFPADIDAAKKWLNDAITKAEGK